MKPGTLIYLLFLTVLFTVFFFGCKKDENGNKNINDTNVKDIDGNIYTTVKIGSQIWMAENLKVTRYRNGDAIPNVTDTAAWLKSTTGAYCNINNDVTSSPTYGNLYNWYAVTDSRNIAPTGWHIPTQAEWLTLYTNLGSWMIAGDKLKETGIIHWGSPNTGATNESGFTALPGGMRVSGGLFQNEGEDCYLWTTTGCNSTQAYANEMSYQATTIQMSNYDNTSGFSVRCIKD